MNKPKRKYRRARVRAAQPEYSIQTELDILSRIHGELGLLDLARQLRLCGAVPVARKYQSLVKSLDGAIRHRQGLRDREDS